MSRVAPTRRHFLMGATALAASLAIPPAFGASVAGFVDATWQTARARGVSRKTFDAAMGGFKPLASVLKLTGAQPEFVSTAASYVGKRVDGAKAATGQSMHGEWKQTLSVVSDRYGVQSEIVLAIWGIETNFGGFMGSTNTIHGLATLAQAGYRAEFFGSELITALEILEAGHVAPRSMVGSWAGAMGHPQFMPSSFTKYAVDFKGEGHKDIWNSVPDALASTANYLRAFGWRPGETWGYEVSLPRDFNYNNIWNDASATLRDWSAIGVRRANGRAFPRESDIASLYMPMGGNGPVFAVLPNFGVIKRYNNSSSYALAVGHLADRILGVTGFVSAWPDDTALNKSQRVELQARLARRGYEVGTPDGIIGPKTRAALMDFQAKAGLTPDGYASGNLLRRLG